ncbi:ComEC/Rec2 family competence protein [Novosphingobium sp. BL-8A]|uniref:ComEC/Rec2 family competence protein n=1 Tax=Novosphingobium sp. BL-8A TaxID=3127639 RepID=UPI003758079D
MQHRPWISQSHMSSSLAGVECFLSNCTFERAPWLAVGFGTGIAGWFTMPGPRWWIAFCATSAAIAIGASVWRHGRTHFPYLRTALISMALVLALGCLFAWGRSAMVGSAPISRPISGIFAARVLSVEEQPALAQKRLLLSMREPGTARAIKVRVNLPDRVGMAGVRPETTPPLTGGALIRFRGRLAPPAPPLLPGGYDFARAAWFAGISASGSVLEPVEVLETGNGGDVLGAWRAELSEHIRSKLSGSVAGIAIAFATGDMGAIEQNDAQAMRDAGLAHLLSISGLHVSAVIGAVYFLALRLLALSPALALRCRLPIVAAALGALAGIGYTLLTGSQVPTVRSCAGALLVLIALALGREALSVRLLATGAFVVMVLWPESIIGPSFQMSFAAVLTLITVANAGPVKRWMAPRDEGMIARILRALAIMLVTGIAIDLVLVPIGLYHFHRAGVYGALANLVAIPLTTFIVMPLVAFALLLDVAGLGAPLWWLADHAIAILLDIAHAVAALPGAVRFMPVMGGAHFLLFVVGGLWLALWSGRVRWFGLLPALAGAVGLAFLTPPDILVAGDGHYIGMAVGSEARLATLRESKSGYAMDNFMEIAGQRNAPLLLTDQPEVRCNQDFCAVRLLRGGRTWHVLVARSTAYVPVAQLSQACRRSDIVIADRRLPQGCQPRWLRIDRPMLKRTGGITIDLDGRTFRTVAEQQGEHGWWHQ